MEIGLSLLSVIESRPNIAKTTLLTYAGISIPTRYDYIDMLIDESFIEIVSVKNKTVRLQITSGGARAVKLARDLYALMKYTPNWDIH